MEHTYCVMLKRAPHAAAGVEVIDFIYSDLSGDLTKGTYLGEIQKRPWLLKSKKWKQSYRNQKPEKDPLPLKTLALRHERQKHLATQMTNRHYTELKQILENERFQEQRRVKQQRMTAAMYLVESSTETSDSSSSSSS